MSYVQALVQEYRPLQRMYWARWDPCSEMVDIAGVKVQDQGGHLCW